MAFIEGGGCKEMKTFILSYLLIILVLLSISAPLYAQGKYPEREIEMVIPWNPGGASDITGRIFIDELGKILKVPVIPVNKPGAGGTLGVTYAHKAKKDGYTILFGSVGHLMGAASVENVIFDPINDFVPIAMICGSNYSVFIKGDSPIKTLEDLIGRAKKSPKSVSIGCALKSDVHLNIVIFQKAAGVEFNIVPFKGGAEATTALVGGHVEAGLNITSNFLQFIKSGDVRILAQIGDRRSKYLPDVPTFKEKGLSQAFIDKNWNGLFVPAGVPKPIMDILAAASEKAVQSTELINRMDKVAYSVEYLGATEFRKKVENDYKLIEAFVKELGLKGK